MKLERGWTRSPLGNALTHILVSPTSLALGPCCGRPGCDVAFPHPRVPGGLSGFFFVVGPCLVGVIG